LNNIFYNNGYNTSEYGGCTVTNKTEQNNYTSNPSFVSSSDFHLQSGSMAIGKGLAITGLTTDYAGNTLKNPPCIGAYESASSAPQQLLLFIRALWCKIQLLQYLK
jgi:hypothetical protein